MKNLKGACNSLRTDKYLLNTIRSDIIYYIICFKKCQDAVCGGVCVGVSVCVCMHVCGHACMHVYVCVVPSSRF